MSKYIDAEKLIAEIERRMKDYNTSIEKYYNKPKSIKAERDSWKWAECKWFLNLITSLQQEQPMDIPSAGSGAMCTTPPKFKLEVKEQPVEGLEEAAEEYATKWHKRPDGSEWKCLFPKGAIRDFIARAEWQKAKILEDAVEIEVKEDAGGYPIVPLDAIELYDYEKDKPLAKAGDKVKVIVIKEDEL